MKRWFKAATAGILASSAMYLLIYLGIYTTGIAAFSVPPSQAFIYNLGIEKSSFALALHFCYGTFWSFVMVYVFEDDVTILKGIFLGITLWIFMMLVYSPLIGWGILGLGYAHLLDTSHPLFLEEGVKYAVSTLILHLIYGCTLGWLNSKLTISKPASKLT